jgi:hypothetical protein
VDGSGRLDVNGGMADKRRNDVGIRGEGLKKNMLWT